MTAARDLDISGLGYATLERDGPQQWPYVSAAKKRLYEDHQYCTPNGKAKFVDAPYRGVAEATSVKFPLALTTHRLRDQWHTMTLTGRSAKLFGHDFAPQVLLHHNDLTRRGIADGTLIRVTSARGSVVAYAKSSDEIRSGHASLPIHWGEGFLAGKDAPGINALTTSKFCQKSKQPELKHAAVKINALQETWTLIAFKHIPAAQLDEVRRAWLEICKSLDFAYAIPVEGEITGVWLQAAAMRPPDAQWLAKFDAALGISDGPALSYDDTTSGNARRVVVANDCVVAARASGGSSFTKNAPQVMQWLVDLMLARTSVKPLAKWLLASALPQDFAAQKSRTLCTCFGVREGEIATALAAATGDATQRLACVQSQLKCGTNCGSCLPELKQMAQKNCARVSA